ncbi:MAG: hypothetical protein QOK22_855 [Gaiellaceae bacterium]|nr:hypothetical protein [Gaiellaceae bacterium]
MKPRRARRIFLGAAPSGAAPFLCPYRLRAVHFHPPSIAPGVIALVWAIVLAGYLYIFLVATGSSRAFSGVLSAVAAAGIWLFVRTRGRDVVGD